MGIAEMMFEGVHPNVAGRLGRRQGVLHYITSRARKVGLNDAVTGELPEIPHLIKRLYPGRNDLTIGQVAPGNNPLHAVMIAAQAKKIVLFDLARSDEPGPHYNLLDNTQHWFPERMAELRSKIEDRIGTYEVSPVYNDLDVVLMQDCGNCNWVDKALADVQARQGKVIIVEGQDHLRQAYGDMIRQFRLDARYYVYSQKGNLICPVEPEKLPEVFGYLHELNDIYAGRTRSCLVLSNPL